MNMQLNAFTAGLMQPQVHVMGSTVNIACRTGVVLSVKDASYDVTWNEHAGTDWSSRPYYLGNGQWVRDTIYTHHYVERSRTVKRNKIVIRTDGSDTESATLYKGEETFWFANDVEFAQGDRVVVVMAGFDRIVLVNETRRFQIFTGSTYSGDPKPDGPLQALGRSLESRLVSLLFLAFLAAACWKASSILPPTLCVALPLAFIVARAIAVGAWNSHRNVFVARVRDTCETALKRLELMRNGMSPDKAHKEAFGDMSGMYAVMARKPWTVAICEALGATALPPVGSLQYWENWYASHLESRAEEKREPTPDEVRIKAAAADRSSREFGRAYVQHRGKVPQDVVAAIGQREYLATRPARPRKHKRNGRGVDADRKWQIRWGQPKWPPVGEPKYTDYMFKQQGWFQDACRNETIPPLPPAFFPDGRTKLQLRSLGRDPAYDVVD